MSETTNQDLSGVAETLLMTLYIRAMESQRPDALIKDEKAVELVKQLTRMDHPLRLLTGSSRSRWPRRTRYADHAATREMDRYARDFLSRHPDAVVVHIGCGLDSRFERVAERNSQVEWYDLDLPDVIELRRKLIGDEGGRYHLLGCSVLDAAWLEAVRVHRGCPFLFLAEGVFMYLTEAQVKSLVLTLRDHFPGAELVFDAWRPFEIWIGNFVLGGLLRWGFWRGQELRAGHAEPTGASIRLLDEWGYFDRPEPRLHPFRWMAPIFRLLKPIRVFHFQLGKAAG